MKQKMNTMFLLSLIFAWLTVQFLFGPATGFIITLLCVFSLLMAIILIRQAGLLHLKKSWFLLLCLIALALTFVYRNQYTLQILNIFVFAGLFIIFTTHLVSDKKFIINSDLIIQGMEQFILPFGEFKVPVGYIGSHLKFKKIKELNTTHKNILIGILISIPVLIVFTSLLASADDIFRDFITIDQFSFNTFFEQLPIAKVIIGTLSGLYIFSFFYYLLYKDKYKAEKESILKEKKYFDTIIQTLLTLINILFAAFVFIQVRYLFVKEIINGMTYSSYAREGFFELTVISLMVILMMIVLKSFMSKTINKVLMTLMGISTLVIAYSAIFRLNLYIEAYGLTWLRILSLSFIYIQIIILLITLLYTWKKDLNIKVLVAVIYLIAYIVLNYVNVDMIIVEKNMDRYYAGHDLDTNYFSLLSYDSVETLLDIQNELKDNPEHQQAYADISKILKEKRQSLEKGDWKNYNYTIEHARQLLNNQ